MTPELIAYAKKIVAERNISQDSITPALMGEILKEARNRMTKAVNKFYSDPKNTTILGEAVYKSVNATA